MFGCLVFQRGFTSQRLGQHLNLFGQHFVLGRELKSVLVFNVPVLSRVENAHEQLLSLLWAGEQVVVRYLRGDKRRQVLLDGGAGTKSWLSRGPGLGFYDAVACVFELFIYVGGVLAGCLHGLVFSVVEKPKTEHKRRDW